MRNPMRFLGALTAVMVVGLAAHSPATAQEEGAVTLNAPAGSASEQLELGAVQSADHGNWLGAAADLEHAARLRAANDPLAPNDLMGAATLYALQGRPMIALAILNDAGRRAEKMGANDIAVRAYIGALQLASSVQDDRTQYFYTRLVDAAKRPGATEWQKWEILGPIGEYVPSSH